ncbi:MAG: CheR family methyltransferase [Phycisphaerae bacterium]
MSVAESEASVTDAQFKRISQVVYDHCGINLHDGKRQLVQARLAKRLRVTGRRDVGGYLEWVLQDPNGPEFLNFIDSLSTNLTSFFRENQHFEYLKNKLLPDLIAKKNKSGRKQLRAWSAGCSSGEEPYTIAMTLCETSEMRGFDAKVLATDISTAVLAKAAAGVYDAERIEGIPPQLRGKYFDPRKTSGGRAMAARPVLRDLISFRHLNLMERWPFTGPFDFIFCRNVMIYFDKPTQEKLVGRFHDCLAPGGILFTGHSESLTGVKHAFTFVQATIYQKR